MSAYEILTLKRLYLRKMCGECFCEAISSQPKLAPNKLETLGGGDLRSSIMQCSMCGRAKHTTSRIPGIINPQSSLCFITQTPLIADSTNAVFLQNKSAQMLQKIIANVFCLPLSNVSILSLIKCPSQTSPSDDEVGACIGFLHAQMAKIAPKVCVIFGKECLTHLLGESVIDTRHYGRILWHNTHNFLPTYSLNEVVRNPSLKPEVMQHLQIAKGML